MEQTKFITDELGFYKDYLRAIRDKKEIFIHEGQEVRVSYAKYVVEYMIDSKRIDLDEPINLD